DDGARESPRHARADANAPTPRGTLSDSARTQKQNIPEITVPGSYHLLRLQNIEQALGEAWVLQDQPQQHQRTARIRMPRDMQQRAANLRAIAQPLRAADEPA